MNFEQKLGLLMSLPPHMAIGEAKSKLTETIMYINNHLCHILQVTSNTFIVNDEQIDEPYAIHSDKIDTMEFYLPLCGVYLVNGHPVMLYRTARRQWKKSFSWNSYNTSMGDSNIYQIERSQRLELYRVGNTIRYYDISIGEVSGGMVNPLRKGFDWELDVYRRMLHETF